MGLDKAAILAALEAALLTDAELAAGEAGWRSLEDVFFGGAFFDVKEDGGARNAGHEKAAAGTAAGWSRGAAKGAHGTFENSDEEHDDGMMTTSAAAAGSSSGQWRDAGCSAGVITGGR